MTARPLRPRDLARRRRRGRARARTSTRSRPRSSSPGRGGRAPCGQARAAPARARCGRGRRSRPAPRPRTPCRARPRPAAGSCVRAGACPGGRRSTPAPSSGTSSVLGSEVAPVCQQPHELLRVQRVAARPLEQRLLRLAPAAPSARAGGETSGRSPRRERARLIGVALRSGRRPTSGAARTAPVGPCRGRAAAHPRPTRPDARGRRAAPRPPSAGPRTRARVGRAAARPSRKRRQAVNSSSRSPAGRLDPDQRRQPLRSHGRSGSSGETAASSFAAAASGGSDSRMPASALTISPSAQNVIPSP